jgi:hypothetical protein
MSRAHVLAWVVWAALSGLLLCDAMPAHARLIARTIRLEGYVGVAPEGARLEAKWSVNVAGSSLALQVTRLQIIAGPGTPSDVVQALKPYRAAAFKIAGDRRQLDELASAAAGSRIELQGNLRLGPARTLLLDTLTIRAGSKD